MNASEKAKEIFLNAAEKTSPAQRQAYLDTACGDDAALRHEVEELLGHHEQLGSFLDAPAGPPPRTVDLPSSEQPGAVIGPYKLLQQIGEGGMGVVWMAEQTQPVQRKVALKVIKPGMDSRQVIARFEAERQALAMMDHVNIARVFDGGTIPLQISDCRLQIEDRQASSANLQSEICNLQSGRPYFVMELVHGVPITKYCDDNHLTPRERLELFVPVCQAIQHAHQKGIIHRDIKPSNVMVTLYDGKPVPKVIDFGVAKATEQKLTERTLFTQYGTMVGTLEYMSPEQAEMSALGVDTRSDIYSLGVLLYELLTGSTPLTHKRMKEAAYAEILRMIKEEEPPKPSTRLSDSGEALASISANRHTEPAKLTKLVRGELDWIVMKTLEKDRNRRYETAKDFAADVQRYLDDEQVQACPPSVGYRFRKFVRRHTAALVTASVIGVALLLAVGSFGWTMRDRAARQSRVGAQADLILDEVGRLEREQKWPEALIAARRAEAAVTGGEADAETAERVHERLKDLEFIHRLEQIRMDKATPVEGKLNYAGVDREYARAFRDYGVDLEGVAIETSIDRLKSRPAFAIPLGAALDDWVHARRQVSKTDTAGWKRLVAVARGIDPEPLRDRIRATWGQPISEVRDELRRLAESIEIRSHHPATIVILARALSRARHSDLAVRLQRDAQRYYPGDFWLNFYLGTDLAKQKDYEGAVRFFTAAVSIRPNAVSALNDLGVHLQAYGKLDEAVACFRKAIQLDPKAALAYQNLGLALHKQGLLDQAVEAYHKAIELDSKYAHVYRNLGDALADQNKLPEAVVAYRRAIELDPKSADAHSCLGIALSDQKNLPDAVVAFHKAIELDPKNANAYVNLGVALHKQRKLPEAIAAYQQAIKLEPKDATTYSNLALTLVELKDPEKLSEAVAAAEKAIELDPKYADAYNVLGLSLASQKKLDAAAAAHQRAIDLNPKHTDYHSNLGSVLGRQKKFDQAIASLRKALEIDPKNVNAYHNLGIALRRQGKLDEAIDSYRKALKIDPRDVHISSNLGNALNELAWALATDAEPARRDPGRAVSLAKEAVELGPKGADRWNTLGAAQYRASNWKEAISSLQKFRELRTNDQEWSNPFFLAMAHWQLGNKEEALQWHAKAVDWMERKKANSDLMRRLRAEAAELLKIDKK